MGYTSSYEPFVLKCFADMATLVSRLDAARNPAQIASFIVPIRINTIKGQSLLPSRRHLVPEAVKVVEQELHADCPVPLVVAVSRYGAAATCMVKCPIDWMTFTV